MRFRPPSYWHCLPLWQTPPKSNFCLYRQFLEDRKIDMLLLSLLLDCYPSLRAIITHFQKTWARDRQKGILSARNSHAHC